MNVYTYYMPVPELYDEGSQRALIDVWARSWRKQGWNPIVMDETWVFKHPRYREFKKKFFELPTEYGHNYEGACFMRWAAVSAAGGGMMTDYDVINYGFPPQAPDPTKMKIFADNPPEEIFLGMVLAPVSLFEGMCQLFASWEVCQNDWNASAKLFHCSDLSLLHRMYLRKDYPVPGWLERVPGCGLYTRPSWKTAPAVHYGYEMKHAGHWPKHAWIEKLRPF